jgi:hypothetical protein
MSPAVFARRQANGARAPRRLACDQRILERSENVLWTLAPAGIVLHNFSQRYFLELDTLGYRAWGFLDGARTVDDVVARCSAQAPAVARERRKFERKIRNIVETLATYGFVVERTDA